MSFKKSQVTGKFSFYLEIQPKSIFEVPITTLSTIHFAAYTNQSKIIPVPLIITWFRGKNGSFTQIESSSSLYHVNGLDVGFYMKAQFKRREEEGGRKEEEGKREGGRRGEEGKKDEGEAFFGPVKIDASIRGTLENILGVGGSKFPVVILNEQEGCEKKVGKFKEAEGRRKGRRRKK